jgi:hypothetical protein
MSKTIYAIILLLNIALDVSFLTTECHVAAFSNVLLSNEMSAETLEARNAPNGALQHAENVRYTNYGLALK